MNVFWGQVFEKKIKNIKYKRHYGTIESGEAGAWMAFLSHSQVILFCLFVFSPPPQRKAMSPEHAIKIYMRGPVLLQCPDVALMLFFFSLWQKPKETLFSHCGTSRNYNETLSQKILEKKILVVGLSTCAPPFLLLLLSSYLGDYSYLFKSHYATSTSSFNARYCQHTSIGKVQNLLVQVFFFCAFFQ